MPFDPTYPLANALIESVPLRNQLTSLKALIDAVGPASGATVDAVATLPPGDPAAATVGAVGPVLHFTFGIPQGFDGPQGNDGAPGLPFANAVVDGVTTLGAGEPATVGVSFDGTNVHFAFGIPMGFDGAAGLPGEVSAADLAAAVTGMTGDSSANSNAVPDLALVISDPPTQAEVQSLADKVQELITALRR